MLKSILCLPCVALLMSGAGAVGSEETLPELRIQIIAGGGTTLEYAASIEPVQDHRPIRSAIQPTDGVWRFRDVRYGEYRVTILSADGSPVYEQGITVNSQTSTIMLSLPVKMKPLSISGTVSVAQLLNPVPKKAVSSFRASQKFIDRGDFEQAARELEKAVEMSPAYAEARASLAAVHIKMGRYVQALTDISLAISAAGPNARDLSNQALAYYHLDDYAQSIHAARRALSLDPNYDPAHFILGVALATDRRTMTESVPHLERAARTIPSANAILAIVQKALSRD